MNRFSSIPLHLQSQGEPLAEWEEDVIRGRPNGCVCFPRREELKKHIHKPIKELVLKWGYTQREGIMRAVRCDKTEVLQS